MNTLVATHDVIAQFNLKKVVQYWGTKIGEYIYFMLSPPWVRTKMVSCFLSRLILITLSTQKRSLATLLMQTS